MADVDLSIFRAEQGSGQAQKKFLLFRAEKILPMIIPLDASALNFRAGPGLGRAARAFYNVKQLKTAFRAGLGPKKISRASRSLPTPVQ
jgi:hypothetical protein